MIHNFDWILFPGSPFLPDIPSDSVSRAISFIRSYRKPTGLAVAIEASHLGVAQNVLQQKDAEYLQYVYGTSPENILQFLYGYSTPTALILGAFLLNTKSIKEAIQLICQPSDLPDLVRLNAYKAGFLVTASDIYQAASHRHSLVWALPIFDLCRKDPFDPDEYFLIGLESSQETYLRLLSLLEQKRA